DPGDVPLVDEHLAFERAEIDEGADARAGEAAAGGARRHDLAHLGRLLGHDAVERRDDTGALELLAMDCDARARYLDLREVRVQLRLCSGHAEACLLDVALAR